MATQAKLTMAETPHLQVWRLASLVGFGSNLLVSLLYVGFQLYHFSEVDDGIFVFLILLNNAMACAAGFHFERRLRDLIKAFNAQEADEAQKLEIGTAFRNIFNHPAALPVALVFAGFIAFWVNVLSPWGDLFSSDARLDQLNLLLTLFLFTGNLMIGYGLFCIGRFWLLSARRISKIRLDVMNPTRPDIAIYQDISRYIVILVAFIATFAIVSLPLSKLVLGVTAALFSIAALGAVAATYLIPMLPLTARFQLARAAALDRIEKKMQTTYEDMMQATDPSKHRSALDEYAALREHVRKLKTLPPGGEFSIFTAVGVSLLTFLPTIYEQLLGLVPF